MWRKQALRIATNNLGAVTIGDIDKLIDKGFKVTISTAMNLDSWDMRQDSPAEVVHDWPDSMYQARTLRNLADWQWLWHRSGWTRTL